MNRKALIGCATVLVVALAGCSESQNLAETGWRLDSLGEAGVVVDAVVTLDFVDDGRLTGETGCNSFNGPYQSDGDASSIGPLAVTRAACPDPARAAMETAYLAALERAETYRIDEHVLTFYGQNDRVLAELARFDPTLEGSSWTVLAYNNGNQAVVSVILDTQITAEFDQDGIVSGSGGCNDYTGPYETEEQRISIGPVAATKQLCGSPGGIDDQEAAYVAALESAELWVIRGDILELRREDGALALSLRPAS